MAAPPAPRRPTGPRWNVLYLPDVPTSAPGAERTLRFDVIDIRNRPQADLGCRRRTDLSRGEPQAWGSAADVHRLDLLAVLLGLPGAGQDAGKRIVALVAGVF